jgi:hypothetical protein
VGIEAVVHGAIAAGGRRLRPTRDALKSTYGINACAVLYANSRALGLVASKPDDLKKEAARLCGRPKSREETPKEGMPPVVGRRHVSLCNNFATAHP